MCLIVDELLVGKLEKGGESVRWDGVRLGLRF